MPHSTLPAPPDHAPWPRVAVARPLLALLGVVPLLFGCSRGDASVTTAHAEGESSRTELRPTPDAALPNIVPSRGYSVTPVTDGGTVAGTVTLDGAPPPDSTVTPPEEVQKQCGASLPLRTIEVQGGRVTGAVVWLEGATHGKALPSMKRYEVSIDGCLLVPRVQAVGAGGTLNVHSEDRLRSLVRLLRWPAGETVATVTTNDEGEVVPDDTVLRQPGTLEVKGAQPPWLRAWVLVFDQPYVATTPAAGTFSIDSVPPGQYKLVAWHERLGRVEQPVTVTPGQTTTVTIHMHAPNAPPNAAPVARPDTGQQKKP